MGKKYSLKTVLALMLSTLALTSAVLITLFSLYLRNVSENSRDNLDELIDVISSRFIGNFDIDELHEDTMRAVVDSLDDNWSFYMSPEEYENYLLSSDNRYQGIGIEVLLDDEIGGMAVTYVYPDSGAFIAGIVAGDIITEIDGESIRGFNMNEIRNALRRPLGDTAVLTVFRPDSDAYHEIIVIYDLVFTNPIEYEMLDGDLGYVLIKNFDAGSADNFIEAVNTLIGQGANSFIYDVRTNNGGRVVEMTRILDFLLPEGEIFVTVDRSGDENVTFSDAEYVDMPSVVLVNSFSYSGAEYFTVTLSEFDYAQTVGEQTTGKNRMQTTIKLSSGGAVNLSTGKYLTRNRVDLYETGGYTPDHVVPLTEEQQKLYFMGELSYEDDPQLQTAMDLIGYMN